MSVALLKGIENILSNSTQSSGGDKLNSIIVVVTVINVSPQHLANLKEPVVLRFKHLKVRDLKSRVTAFTGHKTAFTLNQVDACERHNNIRQNDGNMVFSNVSCNRTLWCLLLVDVIFSRPFHIDTFPISRKDEVYLLHHL